MEELGHLSVARMVDLPFRVLRPRFFQLWLPTTALAVAASVPTQLGSAFGAFDVGANPLPALALLAAMLVGIPVSAVVYTVLAGTVFGAVLDLTEGRPVDLYRSLRSLDLSRLGVIALLYLFSFVGAACCILPGVAVATFLGPATPVAFVEGRAIGAAFQRSLDLVRGGRDDGWWNDVVARSLAVVVVTFLLQYALGTVVTLPQTLLVLKSTLDTAASGMEATDASQVIPGWLTILTMLGSGAVFALVQLYSAAGMLLVYRYARERLEGAGLERAIQDAQQP
jgi:hypothetical protein